MTWAEAASLGPSRSSLLPAGHPRLPCTCPRGSVTGVNPGGRPHWPSVASSGSWENPGPFPPPASLLPPTPRRGLTASGTLQTQPCLGAFARPAVARPQTLLPRVVTWPCLLWPFRTPGGLCPPRCRPHVCVECVRVWVSACSLSPGCSDVPGNGSTRAVGTRWASGVLGTPWGCWLNSGRPGESSGFSQRNSQWWDRKRSPVGPPSVFL